MTMHTSHPDTHTAEWREAQAEHLYQESRKLALSATADDPDGASCWEYADLFSYGWCISLLFYRGTEPDTGATVWSDFDHDTISCDDRAAARALATTRNTPPEQQPHSFDATGVTETGEGER